MSETPTLSAAKFNLGRLGLSLRKTEFGEFRVNFRHGTESTAAYEDDLQAAIDTGLAMLKCRDEMALQLSRFHSHAKAATVADFAMGVA